MPAFRSLLLDLDGTLADTAADLGGALNQLLRDEGRPPLPAERIRPVASDGARGLLHLGFGIDRDEPGFDALRERFLAAYIERIAAETRLFHGMAALLAELGERGIGWGVVTNKPGWLTDPLMAALDIRPPASCVVSGDTVARAKPDPAPLLHAAETLGLAPADCVYVGDARRDIDAATAAGMRPVVAGWGYLPDGEDAGGWGGLTVSESPAALRDWLLAQLTDGRSRHAG